MDIQKVKQHLCGPMIPIITNLHDDLSIDTEAIQSNVRYVVDRGFVTGKGVLLAVGAGGDFPMLNIQERKDTSKAIVEASAGEIPVVIGAQDTNPQVCIELAQWADEIGAYGIQMAPGYYYQSSDSDCLNLFKAVHDKTQNIAIMIYNTWWENYHMSLDQVETLAQLERCVSVKWSTPDGGMGYSRGVARFADKLAVVDNQGLPIMNHLLGGTGYITHLATIWPEHDLHVWNLIQQKQYTEAQQLLTRVNWPWLTFRGKMWNRSGAESPVVKAALELCGRPGGASRLPTRSLTGSERAELKTLLLEIGVPGL